MIGSEQRQLGQSPLSLETIGLARDGLAYAQLEIELHKLVDIHAVEPIDWTRVETLAQTILLNEGKDLNVATWLALAWSHQYQVVGLVAGIQVLCDMHVHYWEQMSPPVKRLRARQNQMQWFLEQISHLVELSDTSWAISPEEHEAFVGHIKKLDDIWQDKSTDAPLLKVLATLVQTEFIEDTETVLDVSQIEPAQAPKPEPLIEPSNEKIAPDLMVKAEALSLPEVDVDVIPGEINAQSLEKNIEVVFSHLLKGLGDLPTELLQQPLLYRLNRIAAWLTVEQAPPAVQGVTRLAPPSFVEIESLARLQQGQDAMALLRFIEARVFSHRYWLDLQRVAYEAALGLFSADSLITQTIQAETQHVIARVPELITLQYQDEMPFANEETRAWLYGIQSVTISETVKTAAVVSTQEKTAPFVYENQNQSGLIALIAAAQAEASMAKQALYVLEQRLATGLSQYIQSSEQ